MTNLNKLWENRETMPVIVTEHSSGKVLMFAYMNKEAFAYTLKTRRTYYYSHESGSVIKFGEGDGNTQRVTSIKIDCEKTALLISVQQKGHVCHHNGKHATCFGETIYKRNGAEFSKRRKFGRVEIDKDFDFSKDDYEDEYK